MLLGSKSLLGNVFVRLDAFVDCHAQPAQHDGDDSTPQDH